MQGKSVTVRKLGDELAHAVELRHMLRNETDPKLLLDTIEGETDLAEAVCAVYEETFEDQILAAGLQVKIEELQARKSRIEQSIETRRGIILMAMDRAGLQQVKGPLATISTKDVPPKLIVTSESDVPAAYWVPQDPRLDKKALKDALDSGAKVPGAELSNGGIGLSIRVK